MKKMESANLAKNAVMLMEKMSSENHTTSCLFNLEMENKMEWTAFKNLIVINMKINTNIQIKIINLQNSEL